MNSFDMTDLVIFVVWSALMLICSYFQYRNKKILKVVKSILGQEDKDEALSVFHRLPSYEALIFDPRHQFRWSTEAWTAWANRHIKEVQT